MSKKLRAHSIVAFILGLIFLFIPYYSVVPGDFYNLDNYLSTFFGMALVLLSLVLWNWKEEERGGVKP